MNSLPKTVTRQRRDCDLNPGPTAPEYSTITTRLTSHLISGTTCPIFADVCACCLCTWLGRPLTALRHVMHRNRRRNNDSIGSRSSMDITVAYIPTDSPGGNTGPGRSLISTTALSRLQSLNLH